MIDKLRKKIDKIDKKIAKLLHKRVDVVKEIASYKAKSNLPVYDKEREEEHLHMLLGLCNDKKHCRKFVHHVFEKIFDESRKSQN